VTVRLGTDGVIELDGVCPVEDAEPLLQLLLAAPAATVDWRACEAAHAAVVQLLLISGAPVRGPPRSDFLARFAAPLLGRKRG
jgi:hypothetical protein